MRKQLKVLLLVAMVAVLFVMAMIVGSAAETDVATGPALVDAVANATDEDIIKLTADVTLDAPLAINRSITIDGQGNTITLAESVTTGQIFDISAEAFTIQNVTVDADGLVNTAAASVAYLFKLSGEVEFMAENVISEFKCFLFTPAVAGTTVDFKGCTLTYTGTYQVMRYGQAVPPASVTFDDCAITAMTVDTTVFKSEGTTVTFNDCVIETNGAVVESQTLTTNFVFTGADTDIKAQYLARFKTKAAMNVTIGELNVAADMQIECTGAVVYLNRAGTYAYTINVHSGTFTAPALVENIGGTGTVVNVANATVNGALFKTAVGKITVANSTVNGVAGANIAEFNIATMFPAANILVVPTALVVNNVAVIDY
ncbi:MAG: hypothetical protein IJC95_04575, partial [Clostridia bacterium]|nr:hypothetical protein [Clostridia bacterium]